MSLLYPAGQTPYLTEPELDVRADRNYLVINTRRQRRSRSSSA